MGQGHPKKISTGQNINPTKTFKSLSPCPLNYKEIRNHNIFQKIKFLIINNKNSKFLSRRLSPDKIEQISPKASIIIPQDSKRKRFNSLNVERALETSQSPNKINRLSIKNNNSYSSFKNIKENDFLKSHRKKSSMFETLNILQQIRPVMSEKMRASLNNSKHNKKFIRKTAFEEEIIKPCESEKKMGDFLKRRKVQSVSEHLQDGSCHFKSPLIAKTQQEGYGGESLFANETTLIKNYALYLNEKKEKKKNERESSLQHKTATKHFINSIQTENKEDMTLKDLDLQIKSSRDPNDPLNDYREMLDHYRHIQFRKELFLNRNNKNPENCSKRNSGLPLEKQNESKPDSNNKINCSESISSRNFNIIPKILFTQNMKKLISEDKFNNDYESLFSGDKNKFRQHFKNFIIYKNKIIQIENRKKEDIMETKNARNETLFMKIVRSGESPTKFFLKKK